MKFLVPTTCLLAAHLLAACRTPASDSQSKAVVGTSWLDSSYRHVVFPFRETIPVKTGATVRNGVTGYVTEKTRPVHSYCFYAYHFFSGDLDIKHAMYRASRVNLHRVDVEQLNYGFLRFVVNATLPGDTRGTVLRALYIDTEYAKNVVYGHQSSDWYQQQNESVSASTLEAILDRAVEKQDATLGECPKEYPYTSQLIGDKK